MRSVGVPPLVSACFYRWMPVHLKGPQCGFESHRGHPTYHPRRADRPERPQAHGAVRTSAAQMAMTAAVVLRRRSGRSLSQRRVQRWSMWGSAPLTV